ncbi:PREDICTED: leucine-rich repeat receptor-like serine/threonine-protein kinase BAM1 [Lupinus angustifolius]|uniref:leucine-rich repeat receptor-like serine/threonine-protein kinase BAM1 n=1 Tax=Lupinus angustifolius TaxID=3871 RepID=UPI00092E990A|nr:PREDICTED: leucine-rich repeat receptor-like serine/threonine-protein kinase BAM1 [Lupinus angustifolius]
MPIIMPTKLFYLLYSTLTIILCLMPSQTNSSTLESDTQALVEIKSAIDPNSIPPSSYLNSWDFTMDPCESTGSQFLGILCNLPLDNSSSRVTALDLDSIGYDGFLTPVIGNLTELTVLNLDNNNFRGPIPETISNLRKLIRLTLSDNFFTGPIPLGISALKNLQHLDVSFNRLSGAIPTNISGLRSLNYMSLSNNAFAGRVPDLTGLWQLQTIDLSINQFYGDIPNLPISLRKIYFNHNILSGHMTPLKGLKMLKWLDISDNRLSGAISKDIMSLKGIVHLNVSYNRFTALEVINYSLEGPMLQLLEAQGNHLRGHLPLNLVTLKNLTSVNLANNQFYGIIPNEYGTKVMTSWTRLYLDNNFLTGDLPPEFALQTNVRGSLSNNCLQCPPNIVLCHGAQRPATQCVGNHQAP